MQGPHWAAYRFRLPMGSQRVGLLIGVKVLVEVKRIAQSESAE
jgi:hypothetical protein